MKAFLRRAAGFARSAAAHPAFVPLLLAWLCLLGLFHALAAGYDSDEIEAVHTAWKILNEGLIYRDFFQHHHPLLYYLLVPLVFAGGESMAALYAAEALALGLLAATVAVVHRTAVRLYDRPTALVAAVLLLAFPFFLDKGSEVRPDTLQVFLLAVSFHFLVVWERGRHTRDLAFSGAFLALSFLALQKAVFAALLFGLAHLYWLRVRKMSGRELVLFWLAFLVPSALALGALAHAVGFRNYLEQNWLMNMAMGYRFSRWDYLVDLAPFLLLAAASRLCRPCPPPRRSS